jgi:hypothetical protein
MFGDRFFGPRFFGNRFFGPRAGGAPPLPPVIPLARNVTITFRPQRTVTVTAGAP